MHVTKCCITSVSNSDTFTYMWFSISYVIFKQCVKSSACEQIGLLHADSFITSPLQPVSMTSAFWRAHHQSATQATVERSSKPCRVRNLDKILKL